MTGRLVIRYFRLHVEALPPRVPNVLTRSSLLLALLSPFAALRAQPEHREQLRAHLQRDLAALAADYGGVLGVQVLDLADGWTAGVNAGLAFPQGSAIKVPILLELFRQAERRPGLLRERRDVTRASQVGGTGVAGLFTDGGSALALEDLAVLMIVLSDNTATNMLVDAVSMDSVNRTLDGLGMPRTRLRRKMIRTDQSARGEENVSTPAEAAALMARLHRCELPVSRAACERVRAILEIPKSHAIRGPLPESVPVAFKPGGLEGVATAWALVRLPDRPYALAVMTNYGFDDGGAAVERVSALAYDHFRRLARSSPHGVRVPLEVIEKVRRP